MTFSNLPNLQSFITGDFSFSSTTSLSLSSMIIKFSINQLDIPFTNGEFNSMLFRDMNVDDIECDESIVVNELLKNRFHQFQKFNYQI